MLPNILFLHVGKGFNRHVVKLVKSQEGFYRDRFGTIYALRNDGTLKDLDPRCGVGLLSLPKGFELNEACRPHDYKFSAPVYKAFYSFEEANADLERDIKALGYPDTIAKTFRWLCDSPIGRWIWSKN